MPVSQVSISILRAHIHTHRHTDTQTHKHTNTQTNTQQPLHPISPTCLCFQGPQLTWQLHRLSPLDVCNLVGLVARDVKLQKQALVRERTFSTQRMLTPHISRVGQNRIYTPYMTVYTPYIKTSYIHRIYMVLANPTAYDRIYAVYKIPCIHRIYIYGSGQPYASYTMGMQHLSSPHPCLILSFYRALCTPHIPVPHISHHRAHRTICISPPASLILQDIHRTPPHISHHRARRTICISPPPYHSTGHSSHPTQHITPQGTQDHMHLSTRVPHSTGHLTHPTLYITPQGTQDHMHLPTRVSFYRTLIAPHPTYHTTGHAGPYASPHPRLILQDTHRTPPHISHHRARSTTRGR